MRTIQFIIFFSIVLTVYGLVNFYIFYRGLQAIAPGSSWRLWYIIIFWLLASTFIIARILERAYPCTFTEVITWIGSFWLAAMLFLFLFVFVVDILRFVNAFIWPFFPGFITRDLQATRTVLFFLAVAFTVIQSVAGYINARIPRIVRHDFTISKEIRGQETITIAMASDIHLGTIIGKNKAEKLVEMLNGLKADIILLAGDIVDEDLAPVIRNDVGASLIKLKAKYGVYGITGNHEYIGGADKAVEYLKSHGISMLRDTCVRINDSFYLAGRDDRDKERFTGVKRKELAEILQGIDATMPLIVMDHQPFNLDKVAALPVDLQISGHTHHGQIWPFNYITKAIYQVSHGFYKSGNTNFYVSCGYGTWGPPIRLGNRPEVVFITLRNNPLNLSPK